MDWIKSRYSTVLILVLAAGIAAADSFEERWRAAGWVPSFEAGMARAKETGRPAFVYFDAEWCSWCQQYKRETLGRPEVRARLQSEFVAVAVDFDARIDLNQRYGVRGLPFTMVISPEGQVLTRFVGILDAHALLAVLAEVKVARAASPPPDENDVVHVAALDRTGHAGFRDAFLAHVDTLYDAELGTLAGRFETGATLKRPSPLTWIYLLENKLWPERLPRAAEVERKRLLDPIDGGFFNFLDPGRDDYLESSKLLETNAWLSAWFAQAGVDDSATRNAAYLGWFFLRQVLWDEAAGGFWQAQVADTKFYTLPMALRIRRSPPPVERIKRADTNAQAAWALLRIARFTGKNHLIGYAAGALDYVLKDMMQDGVLFHIVRDGRPQVADLPGDAFWVLAAGAELEAVRPEGKRRERLERLAARMGEWLRVRMAAPLEGALPVELAGLIAWVGTQRARYPAIPVGTLEWALRQLRIEPETPPDDLVLGLMAWQRYLSK